MKTFIAALVLAAGASGAVPVLAQSPRQTGTLRVVVRDPSGAVIPNATIVIKGTDAATEAVLVPAVTSDGQGVGTAVNLAVGRYEISASFPGFETRTVPDVRVRTGDNKREVTLPIEKIAESVAVGRDPATSASDPKSDE